MIKQEKKNFAQISRTVLWIGLIVCGCLTAARAQVIPSVCFDAKPETLTRTLAVAVNAGGIIVTTRMNQAIPVGFYRVVFNPGGATEESFPIGRPLGSQSSNQLKLSTDSNAAEPPFLFAHAAGETIVLTTDGQAVFGYNNLGSTVRNIPRGVSTQNHFSPAAIVYPGQPDVFQPGIHENIFSVNVISSYTITWTLEGRQATSTANAEQGCATITYQGRLSDAGNAANGQFDLQFQAFDRETGGVVQSELIALENVQVTNGIFTVPLFFGSTLANNLKPRFLEIGVRPGTSTGAFTVLTPRQPLTQVPYAVNAQNAANATQLGGKSADGFLQNSTAAQTNTNFNISGNGTIGGNLNITGTINGTFGQSVTTVGGAGGLTIDAAMTGYTLVPGLTQTVNVPANSSLLISTDGGIQSSGSAVNSYSVVDVSIYVDGAAVSQKRIVIGNNPLPGSVGNWALSIGQTPAAGNHTVEVRVRNGFAGSSSAVVNTDPLLIGRLTVAVIKR